ncbi:unnamed protein product [Rotaria sordida]|uniref:Ig-like domain-containing protein n=1 Tax=Rotaria sordida TaxID=392033 RepID=A0A818VXW5_9BILA|nr:unnamed protein product [Rotaria sordida]
MGQLSYIHPGQYGLTGNNDMFQQQQQQMHQQQQLPMHQQQQQLPIHQQQQQLPIHQQQQQLPIHQQQQQLPIHQQQQQQHQIPPHQQQQQQQPVQMHPQQQQPVQMLPQQQQPAQMHPQQQQPVQMLPQQQQQQQQPVQMNLQQQQPVQMHPQQQYYQGNMQGPSIQSPESIQPIQQQPLPPPPYINPFPQPTHDHLIGQAPSPPISPSERYLVGNLSESFSFEVAPQSTKVTYLGLNGYSLYIIGMGFSNKSKFIYDEQKNRLTIRSLDSTTVGYYSAVDSNWQTFVNILTAIDVSSLQIHNAHTSEDNNGSSLVSCSVSIIRSTFKLPEPPSSLSSNNLPILPPLSLPSSSGTSSSTMFAGTENLPRLDLFISTRTPSSTLLNNKIYNDTLNEQNFTRTISIQRPLRRADHNGTIQCQVESNNNINIFLIKTVPINVQYGPNLEAGALPTVNLESEALKIIAMECQIEGNPTPSYVWYEMSNNNNNSISGNMMPYYGHQNPYGHQYPLLPPSNIPTAGLNVFSTTKQIQRIYQNPGQHSMQCQAQSRGKTIKQEFFITVIPSSTGSKSGVGADGTRGKSYKIPMIIGICIGGILFLVVIAIIIAAIIFLKRRKTKTNEIRLPSEKLSNDKQGKNRWGHNSNLPIDYTKKYKHEVLKGDSSSTSHLVESTESSASQVPPVPNRSSSMTSTHSSYRQAPPPVPVPLAYQEANTFPGSRPPPPRRRSYTPDDDDGDDIDTSVNAMPLTITRSRTTTPFGSHKSLSESIQSLRSNQQQALSLPTKKRSHEPPPSSIISKHDQQTPSPKSFNTKKDYQHHHYHNPIQLKDQQKIINSDASSEEDELQQQQQINNITEDSAKAGPGVPKKPSSTHNQKEYHQQQQHGRRLITPPPPQKMVVHQPTTVHQDEMPPSYHQVSNPSSSSTAYVYQEPTEV